MTLLQLRPGRLRVRPLRQRAAYTQWIILLALSAPLILLFEAMHLPAALLLGPMIAGIIISVANATLRIPPYAFYIAQGVVGCLIARAVPLSIVSEILRDWPLFLMGVISVIAAAAVLGLLQTRWQVLPGTTAIWGSAPGAASAMVLMADAFGADVRLVAFMQYLRVVCVTIVATLVSRIMTGTSGGPLPKIVWFPPVAWLPFLATVTIAGGGAVAAHLLRIPAGPLLVPMLVGVVLQDAAGMTIELPPWLLAASYALVGWSIGLRFTRPILVHAIRAFPRVLGSILALVAICGVFAAILVHVEGIDPLTAYLATSPGGADSVAIIASSSQVDQPFVMAMQVARFLIVLLTGPSLARFIAKRAEGWKTV
jgi:uncharacterized protein